MLLVVGEEMTSGDLTDQADGGRVVGERFLPPLGMGEDFRPGPGRLQPQGRRSLLYRHRPCQRVQGFFLQQPVAVMRHQAVIPQADIQRNASAERRRFFVAQCLLSE